MALSRRGFFRKTTGAVVGALGIAMTKTEVEAVIKKQEDDWREDPSFYKSQYANDPKPSDIYANVSSGAMYSQVDVGERVVPGQLMVLDPIQEKYYIAEPGMVPGGICISYDDLTSTCVMATA